MAFSRLFGKGKRDVSSPTEHLETTEKDDTVIVSTNSPMYPNIRSTVDNLPYQLPNRSPATATDQFQNMSLRQDSTGWQPLQGIHFTLNGRLTGDKDLDNVRSTLESVSSKLNSLDIDSLEYNFALEKSILSS